jgi:hypothetical protein
MGKTKRVHGKGYVVKEDDIKYAYITLVSPLTKLFIQSKFYFKWEIYVV